jgi:hypothetical protein
MFESIRNKRRWKNEMKHELADTKILGKKIDDLIIVSRDNNLTSEQKIEKMREISDFCKGYLISAEIHIPDVPNK